MRWTGIYMPDITGNTAGHRHNERHGRAGQSTTSRANHNHQAQEIKAPQALPCPPRHEVYNADPFLFALHVELVRGLVTRKDATDSWLPRDLSMTSPENTRHFVESRARRIRCRPLSL